MTTIQTHGSSGRLYLSTDRRRFGSYNICTSPDAGTIDTCNVTGSVRGTFLLGLAVCESKRNYTVTAIVRVAKSAEWAIQRGEYGYDVSTIQRNDA
ncbi:hypothetical protein MGU_09269 [Metarhizium guizhouense ARSEF 977]|uniref:Uncharacterized protein n=1 Tax=Metarhizium guizhouense (strain ARSEF 977) TaxID=1276136 RepID=A0A0B4GLL3_METGA|nr:hypothetical protein MGU_09269 [Metarhizium guizhouense ARSEF 977]